MSNTKEQKIGYRDIFRQTEYMKIMIAALINRFGDSIDAIASTWIVYEITGNAAWSAIIYGVNRIPSIIITPLAGAWVEGQKKKTIMIVTDLIRAVCVAFVATGYLFGFLQAWMLLVTTLTISTVEAFRGPASAALTPKVLEKEYYEYGISLSTTLSSMVELIGTAGGGCCSSNYSCNWNVWCHLCGYGNFFDVGIDYSVCEYERAESCCTEI